MGFLSVIGSLIGLFVRVVGIIEKEVFMSLFGFGIFILGIFVFIHVKNSKDNFKESCNKNIQELSKHPTEENERSISQLKILRDLR